MAEMHGPYKMETKTIATFVMKTSAGNYCLTHSRNTSKIAYTGRSDSDLKNRLLTWAEKGKYSQFFFSYASSAKEAFLNECRLYHRFNPADNDRHPDRPEGTNLRRPHCDIFD